MAVYALFNTRRCVFTTASPLSSSLTDGQYTRRTRKQARLVEGTTGERRSCWERLDETRWVAVASGCADECGLEGTWQVASIMQWRQGVNADKAARHGVATVPSPCETLGGPTRHCGSRDAS